MIDRLTTTSQPFVSVIVPVARLDDRFLLCMKSLIQQRESYAGMIEVLFVDNSCEGLSGLTLASASGLKWTRERKIGSYAARNRGILEARGTVLAFTDADCVPDRNWIKSAVETLSSTKAAILGGLISYPPFGKGGLSIYEVYEMVAFPMDVQEYLVEKHRFAATANLITYKEVFQKVGMFDDTLKSNGDREWVHRALDQGCDLRYAGRVRVFHPRRKTFREIYVKQMRILGGRLEVERRKGMGAFFVAICSEMMATNASMIARGFAVARARPDVRGLMVVHIVALFASLRIATSLEVIRLVFGKVPESQ